MGHAWSVAAIAVLAGALALFLTPTVRPFLGESTAWVRLRVHVPLAICFAAGAGVVAENATELVAFTAAGVGSSLLAVIDLSVRRLPDVFVLATGVALVLPLAAAAADGSQWDDFGRSLLAAVVLLAGYFVLALISPAGLGLGDVKFAAVIGAFLGWFGWSHVAVGTVLGFTINGVLALLVLLTRRGGRDSEVPFGPSMILGAVCAVALIA